MSTWPQLFQAGLYRVEIWTSSKGKEIYSNLDFFHKTPNCLHPIFIQQEHLDYSISVIIILLMMTYVDISKGNNLQIWENDFGNRTVNIKWFTYIQRFLQNTHRQYFQNEEKYNYIPNIRYVLFSIKFWLQSVNNVKIFFYSRTNKNSTMRHPLRKLRMLAHSEELNTKHQSKAYYFYHIFTWK